jgi:hypothetical protein
MYEGVLRKPVLCVLALLSGCALIGYELASGSDPSSSHDGGSAGASSGGAPGTGGDSGGGGGGDDSDSDGGSDPNPDGGLLTDRCPNLPDGTRCNVGRFCRLDQRCSRGVCMGGAARDCTHLDAACVRGVCIESTNTCERKAVADGSECGFERSCYEGECRRSQSCEPGPNCDQR